MLLGLAIGDALGNTTEGQAPRLRREAQDCENIGTWPVLAGAEGDRSTVLSSPIILYDHPRIAPESPGDLFDATEIDQMQRRELPAGWDRGLPVFPADPKGIA